MTSRLRTGWWSLLVSMLPGILVGLTSCGSQQCPGYDALDGSFTVNALGNDAPADLVGASVEVDHEREIVIRYTDESGEAVVVRYVPKPPDDTDTDTDTLP